MKLKNYPSQFASLANLHHSKLSNLSIELLEREEPDREPNLFSTFGNLTATNQFDELHLMFKEYEEPTSCGDRIWSLRKEQMRV